MAEKAGAVGGWPARAQQRGLSDGLESRYKSRQDAGQLGQVESRSWRSWSAWSGCCSLSNAEKLTTSGHVLR